MWLLSHGRLLALFSSRLRLWLALLAEYPKMRSAYESHRDAGFFDFGAPPRSFAQLSEHPAAARLLEMRRAGFGSTLEFEADGDALPTYLPVTHATAAALGAASLAAADLHELRNPGRAQAVRVRQSGAALAAASHVHCRVAPTAGWNGCRGLDAALVAARDAPPQRRLYPCADGGAVFVDCAAPPLQTPRLLEFLGCECRADAIGRAVGAYPSADALEGALQGAGLCAAKARAPREWRESAHGQSVAALPPVGLAPVAARIPIVRRRRAAPTLAARAARPLSDVVVVELSDDAIASPVAARTLADHGATVVKVVGPRRPRASEAIDAEANQGKRVLQVDLSTEEGRQRLWNLLKVADVVVDGGDDAAAGGGELGRHGFAPKRVLHRNPHLVYLRASCFGHVGPLARGAGSERAASFCCGVAGAADEGLVGARLLSPLAYTTGFLGAFGVLLALADRQVAAVEGKPFAGVLVLASLAQTATWLGAFGARCPSRLEYALRLGRLLWGGDRRAVDVGDLRYLPLTNAVEMPHTPARRHAYERWWPDDEILLPA